MTVQPLAMGRKGARLCLAAVAVIALALTLTACRRPAPGPAFTTTATVKDIMKAMVDPSADVVWNAVATVTTEAGMEDRAPRSEEEWLKVRHHALIVAEATNLLMIPGRHVAAPGERSENPTVELHPDEIEKLIADDPATWRALAAGLHDATGVALVAIDKRNANAVFDAGENIDKACEACHLHYWYPQAIRR